MSQNLPKLSLQGFSVLRHPNHLLLAEVNNRNYPTITHDQANRDFFWYTDCLIGPLQLSDNVTYFS